MGADGFIVDPTAPMYFEMRCHQCGRSIDMDDCPINEHHECVNRDGRLPVNIDLDNYEER